MKTAVKLVLIYLGIQLLSALIVSVPVTIYNLIVYSDSSKGMNDIVSPSLLLAIVLMGLYLWTRGYISSDRRVWSPVSATYCILTVFACLASVVLVDYIVSLMPWLPNLMESTFDVMMAGWLGILVLSVAGPVLEEVLFRGAITTALLKRYSPAKAIVLSALVFGIFHINPVQVVGATLIGLLLAWIFYKTASLIPCILIHIINNALSAYLDILQKKPDWSFPDANSLQDLFADHTYYIILIAAIVVFLVSIRWMKRTTVAFPWKEGEHKGVEPINSDN